MNELIKGGILFFAIGLLYFIITLLVEHFLWLNTGLRTALFWAFVLGEFILFLNFIVIPISKLFKLKKGIGYEEASKLIGNHFPEVNDKLLNLLQLSKDASKSELLLAGINQKSSELSPVPFKLAVNFKGNLKYIKYALIPILILFVFSVVGKINWFTDSYKRVVDYKTAYEPPAPFQFFVLNQNLEGLENKDFKLLVKTAGHVSPEQVDIRFNDESYFMKATAPGSFEFIFEKPKSNISFRLQANEVLSKPYELQIVEVPTLLGFDMILDFPTYTEKTDEILKSSGNAIVPEGTKITWKLKTKGTDKVTLFSSDTLDFIKNESEFVATKQVFSQFNYSLSTSNSKLDNFENLNFNIQVIKDLAPEIQVEMVKDSLDMETLYFKGTVSDDYGLRNLNLVYYKTSDESEVKKLKIQVSNANVDEFYAVFPNHLNLEEGVAYSLFFEVFDNDTFHGFKRSQSQVFSYRGLTQDERTSNQLQQQKESISDLNKSLEQIKDNEKVLENISTIQKSKQDLNFNDRRKLQDVLKRQQQQESLMKNFNKSFQENLKELKKDSKRDDVFKEQLERRLNDNEKKLEADEKLLDELKKIQDKINNEELSKKLEELSKQNKTQKRSLEQLVELTKRYYVATKMEKLQRQLEQLSKDQLQLSQENVKEYSYEKQNDLNEKYKDFQKQLDALNKDNNELKRPMELPRDVKGEEDVKEYQRSASEALNNSENENLDSEGKKQLENAAKQNQKRAGNKMKEMSQAMQNAMQIGGGEQMQEDTEMLRQILDNVLLFSFDEEQLMNKFKGVEINHNNYGKFLKRQHDLREYFEHVDDSLFALSLRQPLLSEQVNTELTNVYFNIDKALENLAENNLNQGVSSQQYVFTAANNLADLLSNILDNMEDQLNASSASGQGASSQQKGESEGQLQDIIMSQEALNKQMKEALGGKPNGKQNGREDGSEKSSGSGRGNQGEHEGNEGEKKGGNSESGSGQGEQMNGEIFSIYQKQQELRVQLEERLRNQNLSPFGRQILRDMEDVEMKLLNEGITSETLEKMISFQHQLLKLDNASFQQEEDSRRDSHSNYNNFSNPVELNNPAVKQYFNTTEILIRQILPLQPSFKQKVQQYFKKD